jgi:hypothetical protein
MACRTTGTMMIYTTPLTTTIGVVESCVPIIYRVTRGTIGTELSGVDCRLGMAGNTGG